MRVPNPCCCGCPLQQAVKIWAIYHITCGTVCGIFLLCVFLILASLVDRIVKSKVNWDCEKMTPKERHFLRVFFIAAGVYCLVIYLVRVLLGVVLLLGSNNRSSGKCKCWLITNLVLFILYLVSAGLSIWLEPLSVIGSIIGFIEMGFGLWLVYAFFQELKTGVPGSNGYQQQPPPPYTSNSQVAPMQNQSEQQNTQAVETQNQPAQQQQNPKLPGPTANSPETVQQSTA